MKRILLLLLAALMAFALVSTAASEGPETEPAEQQAEEAAEEQDPGEEIPGEEIPGEEIPGEGIPEEEIPGEEEPPKEEGIPEETAAPAEEVPAEEEIPAVPGCAHENTETVYYFDAPEYRPLNDESHLVIGQAVAEVDCLDCGAVVSIAPADNAEEIRPHVYRNSICVLCGRESKTHNAAPAETESVIHLSPAGEAGQYTCTLTEEDLAGAGDTLVLRPEGRDAAIAVQTDRLREEIERAGGHFTATIWKQPEEQDISTALCLYDAQGEEIIPVAQGFTLRIYAENREMPLTVSYTNLHGATSSEEARWVKNNGDEGYWIVTWLGDGMYEYR